MFIIKIHVVTACRQQSEYSTIGPTITHISIHVTCYIGINVCIFAIISVVCYCVYLPVSTCILYLGENIIF